MYVCTRFLKVRLNAILLIIALVSMMTTSFAQEELPVIRQKAEEVIIPVTVLPGGQFKYQDAIDSPLSAEHFTVSIDKVKEKIESFQIRDVRSTVVIAYDVSGSMGDQGKLEEAKKALDGFAGIAGDDYYAIIVFNGELKFHPPRLEDFTTYEGIRNQLSTQEDAYTAYYDAVYVGIEKARQGPHPRFLIVISDGMENDKSRYTFKEVKRYAQESGVQIDTICIYRPGIPEYQPRPSMHPNDPPTMIRVPNEEDMARDEMKELAELTGGMSFVSDSVHKLQDYLIQIALFHKRSYQLTVVPSKPLNDGKKHTIKIEINHKKLPKWLKNQPLRLLYRKEIQLPK